MKLYLLLVFNVFSSFLIALQQDNIDRPDEILEYLLPFLPDNPVILEAGGNRGEDTMRMKKVWPEATLYVFEPLPSSFEKLEENIKDLTNIFCHPIALSSIVGETDFYVNQENPAASSIGAPVGHNEREFEKEPIKVRCTTIDEWAKTNNVSRIDFIWLDVEGHELEVFQNGQSLLDSVKAIYTEVDFSPIRVGCSLYPDLQAFLKSKGFEEVWLLNAGAFGNALYIRD